MRTGLRSLVIAAALLRATAVLAAGAGVARPIAIVHGTILDGRGGPPLRDGTIVVRGGVIAAVGPSAQAAVPREAQVIDARGKSILPGLADLHIHLSGGWDGTNADFLSYQRYLNALLYAGVTTVLDTGNN